MCYCTSKRWFRHTCDLINCSLILYWMRSRGSVWKYLLQLYIVICANYWLFWLGCLLLIVFCVWQWASFFACVLVPCVLNWCEEPVTVIYPWSPQDKSQSWYGGYTKSAWEPHIVLLYEWLQNFETKEPTRREWCKLLKKWEQQTHQQPQCELLPSDRCLFCEMTQITRKQHAENISQMYDKNSWGSCQRSNNNKKKEKKISTSFWKCKRLNAHYQATCQRDSLKPLKSKLPTRPYIFSTSFSMLSAESFKDTKITTLRKNYETGTFHASSL